MNRIWYVVEAGVDARNFSVNRTCALACSPSCVVIGDRTKVGVCVCVCGEGRGTRWVYDDR